MQSMESIVRELLVREAELKKAIFDAEKYCNQVPKKRLRVAKEKKYFAYYEIEESGDTRGKYIKKNNLKLAEKIVMRDYANAVKKEAYEEIIMIQKFVKRIEKNPVRAENLYGNLKEGRKRLATPLLLDDEEFQRRWIEENYIKSDYKEEDKVYPTKKGDMVRSKSEVMLANMYYELGIPYRYECELELNSGKKVYPDFTLLKKEGQKIIYHEHMGMLDYDEYRFNNFKKIDEYRRNGIFVGKNLLITHEGDGSPFNIKEIEKCICEIFEMK